MANRRIGMISGDGIGPEISAEVRRILSAAGFDPEWVELEAGQPALDRGLPAMPEATIQAIRELGIALKGPTATPIGKGHVSANVALRKALDLFANVRPSITIPNLKGHFEDTKIDLIIVRENTEDLYAGIEFQPHKDIAQAIKVITRPGCKRIFKYAFEMVKAQGRKRITAVHKANIMKLTDGMFLEEFYLMANEYPDIIADDIIVDNCCMQLVVKPEQFDVIVTENLYGDILSDLCAGLVGGLGVVPGANVGERVAIFEPVHGSAPDIAGQNKANPTALLKSAILMLHHLGEHERAEKIMAALLGTLSDVHARTGDLGGKGTTSSFGDAIIARLGSL